MTIETLNAAPATAPVWLRKVAPGVVGMRIVLANVYFVGPTQMPTGWALVDAGIGPCAGLITRAAEAHFGAGARPAVIVLTHGHFDHIGAVRTLAEHWDVPVYAHPLELPYLTGQADYPPPDPSVGGGLMSLLSPLFPRKGIDLGERVRALPEDGSVPHMPGWSSIHTPGHSPGHVSLFREADRVLLAGDAIVTTRQESALAVATQAPEVRRPPAYFTINWVQARQSVEKLATLCPSIIATGHGQPMEGTAMDQQLQALAQNFEQVGVPSQGRYVTAPALPDANGIVPAPPAAPISPTTVLAVAAAIGLGFWLSRRRQPRWR